MHLFLKNSLAFQRFVRVQKSYGEVRGTEMGQAEHLTRCLAEALRESNAYLVSFHALDETSGTGLCVVHLTLGGTNTSFVNGAGWKHYQLSP